MAALVLREGVAAIFGIVWADAWAVGVVHVVELTVWLAAIWAGRAIVGENDSGFHFGVGLRARDWAWATRFWASLKQDP